MKKVLILILVVFVTSSYAKAPAPAEKVFTFKFTEKVANQIVAALQTADGLSARDANLIIGIIQAQASDTTLNKK